MERLPTMPTTITITDETTRGHELYSFTLDFLTEQITIRELIRSRIYEEVQTYNANQRSPFRGLIQPTATEAALNGDPHRTRAQIDWEQQYALALSAFAANGFLILVDDRQVTGLDTVVALRYDTRVTFVKLVPLVGG